MSRGLTFALQDLPPKMREQAQAKLALAGTARTHVCSDNDGTEIKVVRGRRYSGKSKPEELFALQMDANSIAYVREHRFHHERKWRWDFAILEEKIAIEIDGVMRGHGGRHQRIGGFERDLVKINAGIVAGWRVLRFTPNMVKHGDAMRTLKEIL